jgi:poly(3-hydroxybutyrate) depolymerase
MRMILTRTNCAMTAALAVLSGACGSSSNTTVGGAGSSSAATSAGGGLVGSGGLHSSGGLAGAGGIVAATGGQVAFGGALATGGAVASGGKVAVTGGQMGTGGRDDTGGSPGSGGRNGSGGNGATGGLVGSGGTKPTGSTVGSGGVGLGGSTTGSGGRSSTGTTGNAGSSATGGSNTNGGSSAGVPSSGCGKTSTLTFGTVPNENANATPGGGSLGTGKGGWVTITSGGQSRNFALRLPDNYDNTQPYWLIFAFHGNGETADGMDTGGANGYFTAYWGLQRESKNGAIFVAPEWSGGGWGTGDLTFTDDMVKTISTNYCVDMSNIITSGFSYGGGMSHALACSRASTSTNSVGYKFRAAVMFEACSFLVQGTCPNSDPIDIWQKAGLTDGTCGFDDSKTVRNWFTARDGCTGWTSESGNVAASATGTVSQEPTQPPTPGKYINPGGHVCTNYTCSKGAVRWCADQAGHGNATTDGSSSLYDECANVTSQYPHGNCSPGCPCTWTPDDIWTWLKDPTANKYTPNITAF